MNSEKFSLILSDDDSSDEINDSFTLFGNTDITVLERNTSDDHLNVTADSVIAEDSQLHLLLGPYYSTFKYLSNKTLKPRSNESPLNEDDSQEYEETKMVSQDTANNTPISLSSDSLNLSLEGCSAIMFNESLMDYCSSLHFSSNSTEFQDELLAKQQELEIIKFERDEAFKKANNLSEELEKIDWALHESEKELLKSRTECTELRLAFALKSKQHASTIRTLQRLVSVLRSTIQLKENWIERLTNVKETIIENEVKNILSGLS